MKPYTFIKLLLYKVAKMQIFKLR